MSALVYEPKFGGWGEGCGVSANKYSCALGAQISFEDLIPYYYVGDLQNTLFLDGKKVKNKKNKKK